MRLWKLTPRHDSIWWCQEGKDPWHPHPDRAFGFVVRAEDASEARWHAHQAGGEENQALAGVQPWLDHNYSRCDELTGEGPAEIVLVNFRHGRI
jgi:hypothetical protein